MTRYLTTILVLSVCAFVTTGQTPPVVHQHNSTAVVDGAVNPDQIPDSVSYRLCMVAFSVSQSPSDTEQKRQHAQLAQIGLAAGDQQLLIGILSDFKAKYDALVTEYNNSSTAASLHNQTTDGATLMAKLDGLIQTTRTTIGVQLSSAGVGRLHSFVMSEKKNMKVQGD